MDRKVSLETLWEKGCQFLGVEKAILGGAMTWVSNHTLVSAISNAGGFGIVACGAMTPDLLEKEISETFSLTNKPFGVNVIVMHPQLSDLIKVAGRLGVSHVVLAGGIPQKETITAIKDFGCKVIAFAPALVIAKKLEKMGVDALIIEGNEAGGHVGPVSTSVLAQEILPFIKTIPIFVAGGIGRGEAIITYLEMGAAGCQLGTRFVCAYESLAHQNFKNAFLRAHARDAVVSTPIDPRFPVIPVRALSNEATQAFTSKQKEVIKKYEEGELSLKEAQLTIEHFWAGALRRGVLEGDIETGSLMAGQSVGMVTKEQSTQEIIDELVSQAQNFLESRQAA